MFKDPAPSVLLGAWHLYDSQALVQTFLDDVPDSAGLARSPEIPGILVEKAVGEEDNLLATLVTELFRPAIQVCHDRASLRVFDA
jgi:hypothetical protein